MVGVPHPHSGEAVKAYVVVRDGAVASRRTTSSPTARRTWPGTSAPQKVMFVDELPQSATGKVLRKLLPLPLSFRARDGS